jgi:predicted transcriptional regulator
MFTKGEGLIDTISDSLNLNPKTIRGYLNKFCEDGFLVRNSELLRDKNAIYTFNID